MMNVNKVTPEWFVQGDTLRLSIQHFKRNETSSGHSGCSANWMQKMEGGDFVTAYNKIVEAAKQEFDLKCLKKIPVPKENRPQPRNYVDVESATAVNVMSIVLALIVGAVVGSIFF